MIDVGTVQKGSLLYEGKAKKIFSVVGHEDMLWLDYKDSLTAFNALKKGEFAGKGRINCQISTILFHLLQERGVSSHWIKNLSDHEMLVRKVEIIPLEVVVRRKLAGSTAKKFALAEGTVLPRSLVEFYYKNDELNDPFISDDQALIFNFVKESEISQLKKSAVAIGNALNDVFAKVGIELIDFKVEFGRLPSGEVCLADEISPDCARLWDIKTGEKMDKDRFRRDLGNVEDFYSEILQRLQKEFPHAVV